MPSYDFGNVNYHPNATQYDLKVHKIQTGVELKHFRTFVKYTKPLGLNITFDRLDFDMNVTAELKDLKNTNLTLPNDTYTINVNNASAIIILGV